MHTNALQVFKNPNIDKDYLIEIEIPEFSCVCPVTGQPDFATIYIQYIPDLSCLELKSIKLYVWSFRDKPDFHEAITNNIIKDIENACAPRFARVRAKFNVRGGTYPTITCVFKKDQWELPPDLNLLGIRTNKDF